MIYIIQSEVIVIGGRRMAKKKKPFGGYSIGFKDRKETLEKVFGNARLTPSAMTKKLWQFIKSKRLANK